MRTRNACGDHRHSDSDPGVHIAVIYAVDGVRFLAARSSVEAIWREVAGYVRANAGTKLWPGEAARVRELLERGRMREAIRRYFERVGDRWDVERLHIGSPPHRR